MLRWLILLGALLASGAALAEDLDRILEAGTIRAGVCLNAEPSGFRDSSGNPRGYDVDVATLMAEQLGVELQLVEVTGSSRIPDLLDGRIDVIACNITATPERARSVDFSFPYLRTGLKLLVGRDSGIAGMDDLTAETRIVVGRGTTGEALVRRRLPEAQFVYIGSPGDAALLMREGRGDVYVDDSLVVDYVARADPERLVSLPETYSFDAISFGLRKGNPALLRWLDLFASIYVSSGRYAETYARWWGGEPPPLTPIW